jgi:glycerate-2-kinase
LPASRQRLEATRIRDALAASDSYPLAAQVGEPIMIAPTGNNLRDLFLIARNQARD